jgi:hypothetical protein
MPRLTLADYQSHNDQTSEEIVVWEFDLPDNFVPGTGQAIPILMFRVDADKDCNVWVHLNDAAEVNLLASSASIQLKVRGGHGQKTVHELINGAAFRIGRKNTIKISKPPNFPGSRLWISDVVLHYQLYVDV